MKKQPPSKPDARVRSTLHPRNLHNQAYEFEALCRCYPPLKAFVRPQRQGAAQLSIDYDNNEAVIALNTALLKHHYGIDNWTIPEGALCSPIPGRADYIHYMADLLEVTTPADSRQTPEHTGHSHTRLLDIGTGANGIYPLLASSIYGWHCVGSDISEQSLTNVERIIGANPQLKDRIALRLQKDKHKIFEGNIQAGEYFDLSVCNPPFYASEDEALKHQRQKRHNLGIQKEGDKNAKFNFGGHANELWCNGGEKLFLKKMIKESVNFKTQCRWFSSLVSKKDNIAPSQKLIRKLGAQDSRVIEMLQGKKITRILAWRFI